MKKLPPWQFFLLVIWPYAALAANLFLIRIALIAWLCGLLGTLIVTILSTRCALHQRDAFAAAKLGMLAKLVHIPAYLLSAVLAAMLWMAPPLILALLLTNVCMLAASSAYGLCGLLLAWREKRLTDGWAIVLAVSQCIFVLDVPGSLLICHRVKKEDSHAERTPS